MTANQLLDILVVDDFEGDIELVRIGFARYGIQNPIVPLYSGEEFMAYLQKVRSQEARFPGLVLLDVNLSGLSGHDVLKQMRADPLFYRVPAVVMLSHSSATYDKITSQNNRANGYFVKPITKEEWRQFCEFIECILSDAQSQV